jgi:hypothetical protein
MKRPPLVVHLRLPNKKGGINLWIPIFLVYPLLLAIALLLAPFVLIGSLLMWPSGWGRTVLLSGPVVCRLLWNTRGLKMDIQQKTGRILVSVD